MALLKLGLLHISCRRATARKRPLKMKRPRTGNEETKGNRKSKKRRKMNGHADEGSSASLKPNYASEVMDEGIRTTDPLVDVEAENEGFEDVSSSLRLVRSLQSKELPLERKIDLAYRFVDSLKEQQESLNFCFQWEKSWMGMPQLVSRLNDWIQSILISSTKQNTASQTSAYRDACLDVRCWVIFKWCLQSKYLERASFSSNLMRSINFVLTEALAYPENSRGSDSGCPLAADDPIKHEQRLNVTGDFMKEFREVVGVLFSLHGRNFRPTLDLWASSAVAAVKLVDKVLLREDDDDYRVLLSTLTCLMLDEFVKYLGSHPNPRNVFPVIVEKLLEPLLSLLVVLGGTPYQKAFSRNDILYSWRIRMVRIIEDIFAFGLFHSVHIDGYLNICNIDGCVESQRDVKAKKKAKLVALRKHEREDSHAAFVSYHKSLFQKLEYIRKEGNTTALHGIGRLLSIFICKKKNQGFGASQFIGTEKTKTSRKSGESPEAINISNKEQVMSHYIGGSKTSEGFAEGSITCESKHSAIEQEVNPGKQDAVAKPLINLFVEFMEPLQKDLEDCEGFIHLQDSEKFQQLSRFQSTLVSINSLLAVVKDESIYVPTEDTPGQAHFNHLKKIYKSMFKLGALIPSLCSEVVHVTHSMGTNAYDKSLIIKQHMHDPGLKKLCTMVMMDIVLAFIYLLEIEYRVAEDELLHLWLLLLSFSALNLSWNKEQDKSSMLTSQIVFLGCRIISIYGELRQIDRPLFRLFESIRFFIFGSHERAMEKEQSMFLSSRDSLASTDCVQAVVSLVCSQEFLNGVAAVVSAVPEGQVAQCIKLLKVDVMDTLEWMKKPWMKGDMKESQVLEFQNPTNQDWTFQAEVVGKALSELYSLVLDKSCVTLNNSIPVGNSVKEVVDCVSVCFGNIVKRSSKQVENFWQHIFSIVTGKKTSENKDEDMKMQARMSLWGSWFLVFILRLFLSSRSLYRQCISLMPPKPARKSSVAICDLFTAYSGDDWIRGEGNLTMGGYFSWIDKPSASVIDLLTVISESIEKNGIGKGSALLYVLQNIALQRLADLNRHIKGLEYLHDKNVRFSHAIVVRNNELPTQLKEQKQLENLINVSRQEASALTDFILKYAFSLVADKVASKICLLDMPGNITVCAWNSVVGTLDKLSVVVAVWQLVCHNVDIWSYYASKKSRKKFVSKLLGSFLSLQRKDSSDANLQFTEEKSLNDQKLVTVEEISSELLRNVALFEQEFFCRYSASKMCQKIRKSLLLKLNRLSFLGISSTEDFFGNLQDWPKFTKILEELVAVTDLGMSFHENIKNYKHGLTMMQVPEVYMEENQDMTSCEGLFGDWIKLLNLICWLPKGYGGVKSLSEYAHHILIIERFLVITLHRAVKTSHSDPWAILQCSGMRDRTELLALLLACRKALKSITLSSDDDFEDRLLSLVQILFESSSSCMWLLRSVYVIAQWFSERALLQPSLDGDLKGNVNLWEHLIFSTLDHTSGMLMIVCEGLFNLAAKSLISNVYCISQGDNLSGIIQNPVTNHISENKFYMDIHTPLIVLAEALTAQARDTLVYLKHGSFDVDLGLQESVNPLKSNSNVMGYSSQVSETGKNYHGSVIGFIALVGGIRSILWGLASALDNLDEKCRKDKTGYLRWQNDLLKKWEQYVEDFKCFVNHFIRKFLIVDAFDEAAVTRDAVASQHDSSTASGQFIDAELAEYNLKEDMENISVQEHDNEMKEEKDETEENNLYDNMEEADNECNGVIENDNLLSLHPSENLVDPTHVFETPDLNKTFLDKLLKGEKPAQATLLGELFMALAGLVKLKHLSLSPKVLLSTGNIKTMSVAFMNSYIGAADWIILEAAKTIRSSRSCSLGWVVGIVKYLESIGSFIPYMTPIFPPMAYAKLINLHLQAIAAVCFPVPAETKNSVLHKAQYKNDNQCSPVIILDNKSSCFKVDIETLNDLKAALRRSFSMLVRKPLQVHLSLALQSIERTLAGVWIGNNIASELHSGNHDGGKVGRMVASGVECLDLALDSVSGPKRMKLLAKHSSTFVAALLNIIVHLQGPQIFFVSRLDQCQDDNYVDKALVILSCVEVLSKVASRHTIFPLSASHVGQSLAFPAVLFQHLCQFKSTQNVTSDAMPLKNQAMGFKKATLLPQGTYTVMRKVSVELYISCCRLLCALLRHRNRETGHCMALLGESVRIFLFCLEIVDRDMNAKCWTVEEGVTCAIWLRRVYEEMGQHKETLGRYCSHILSDYICVVCGFGPANSGLHREIDEALRPGAYALIDSCSLEDLQQMHAVLGEGPCRSALQMLKNDYERHFKYTGKI